MCSKGEDFNCSFLSLPFLPSSFPPPPPPPLPLPLLLPSLSYSPPSPTPLPHPLPFLPPLPSPPLPSPPLLPTHSDRLGELERDKVRLSEQLVAQQREQLVREMDVLKRSKSKNLLKKGFKKLKGKIQVRISRLSCIYMYMCIQLNWHNQL